MALTVRAGVRIGTTLDMITTAREIAEVVIPAFADRVTVDLVEGVLEGEEPRPHGDTPPLVRVVERVNSPYEGPETEAPSTGPCPVEYEPGSPQLTSLASRKAVTVEGERRQEAPGEDEEEAAEAARSATLALLATLKAELGSLDRVRRIVRVSRRGCVATTTRDRRSCVRPSGTRSGSGSRRSTAA